MFEAVSLEKKGPSWHVLQPVVGKYGKVSVPERNAGDAFNSHVATGTNKAVFSGISNRDTGRKVETIRLTNGIYTGEVRKGLPHGRGTVRWDDGAIFEGNFIYSDRTGYGILKETNGDVYAGNWVKGQLNGYGTQLSRSGYRYEGNWVNGKKHGKGKSRYPDDTYYEGEYADNNKSGRGTINYKNGDSYSGGFKFDKKSGVGCYYWADGVFRYRGEWLNDVRHGKGRYLNTKTEQRYIDEWQKGKLVSVQPVK